MYELIYYSELVGNCDIHCRIVNALLQKGPWNQTYNQGPPDINRASKRILVIILTSYGWLF
jgi:hypothetical protein